MQNIRPFYLLSSGYDYYSNRSGQMQEIVELAVTLPKNSLNGQDLDRRNVWLVKN